MSFGAIIIGLFCMTACAEFFMFAVREFRKLQARKRLTKKRRALWPEVSKFDLDNLPETDPNDIGDEIDDGVYPRGPLKDFM